MVGWPHRPRPGGQTGPRSPSSSSSSTKKVEKTHPAWRRRFWKLFSEIVGAEPWPGMRHIVESIYEYGSRAGFWRLLGCLPAVRFNRLWCGHGVGAQPGGGRHAASGLGNRQPRLSLDRHHNMDEATERAHLREAIAIHPRHRQPSDWLVPRAAPYAQTRGRGRWVSYDSDSYADDLPYWCTRLRRPHLIIPTLTPTICAYRPGFNSRQFSLPSRRL